MTNVLDKDLKPPEKGFTAGHPEPDARRVAAAFFGCEPGGLVRRDDGAGHYYLRPSEREPTGDGEFVGRLL